MIAVEYSHTLFKDGRTFNTSDSELYLLDSHNNISQKLR